MSPETERLLGIPLSVWDLVFSGTNALVVVIGIVFAVYNLRLIAKQQYFSAFTRFTDDLATTREHRRRLYQSFGINGGYSALSEADILSAQEVINFLDRTAVLIEERMLPPYVVLALCHTLILRCWHRLEPYAAFQEVTTGGWYGRRVRHLARQAERFHDSQAHQRGKVVMLFDESGERVLVYRTVLESGIKKIAQQAEWFLRNLAKRY